MVNEADRRWWLPSILKKKFSLFSFFFKYYYMKGNTFNNNNKKKSKSRSNSISKQRFHFMTACVRLYLKLNCCLVLRWTQFSTSLKVFRKKQQKLNNWKHSAGQKKMLTFTCKQRLFQVERSKTDKSMNFIKKTKIVI